MAKIKKEDKGSKLSNFEKALYKEFDEVTEEMAYKPLKYQKGFEKTNLKKKPEDVLAGHKSQSLLKRT
jgi:hypothetical protein